MAFIDARRDRFGVEPICAVLTEHGVGIAPSTYYAAKAWPLSARARRDEFLCDVIARVHRDNYDAYGAVKVWEHLNEVEAIGVARCTVERLMRELGLRGVRRGGTVRTTIGSKSDDWPADLVKRDFSAPAPDRLWLADLTYVRTRSGWVYAAFVIDACSRRVLGWQTSRSLAPTSPSTHSRWPCTPADATATPSTRSPTTATADLNIFPSDTASASPTTTSSRQPEAEATATTTR